MSRIRTIKPEFWTDAALIECSLNARLLFIGTWNFADDEGNLDRSPKQIKARIFPADSVDCEPMIQELLAHGLLIEYSVSGKKFLHIHSFKKHQVINRPGKPQCPIYDDSVKDQGAITDCSPPEGKGREGNGKEEKQRRASLATRGTRLPDDWVLPKAWGEWALAQQPTWTKEHCRTVGEVFKRHWLSVSGSKGVKLNWEMTWQNWVVREGAMKINGSIVAAPPTSKPCAHCKTPLTGGYTSMAIGNVCNPCYSKYTAGEWNPA